MHWTWYLGVILLVLNMIQAQYLFPWNRTKNRWRTYFLIWVGATILMLFHSIWNLLT